MATTADRLPVRRAPAPPAPAPAPGKAALEVRAGYNWLLTIGVMAATIMQILDSTIANVALPHMQSALGATADTVNWVLTSYIVASAIAIPVTGWLSDSFGSRNLFLTSVAGFVLASMLCGAAQSLPAMVGFRVLQGIFAAFMNPLSQTVMLDINPPERQPRAMSIWGMGIMVGPIMGPLIGGWLTDNYNWRWVFYVNLPIGIICFAILWALLPSRPIRKRRLDPFGFAMLAIALASFQVMLDRGETKDWFDSWEIRIEAMLAISCGWMFVVHLLTARAPMFDRVLITNRNLLTGLGFMLLIGVLMFATMALLPPMLQRLFGYPVLDTGMLLMPRGVGVLISMAIAGQAIQRGVDARWLVGTGLTIAAFSLWEMTRWTLVMGTGSIVIPGLIQGLGMGLVFIPLNLLAFSTLPPQYRTEGASLMNLFRSIGASVGISIVSVLLAQNVQSLHQDIGGHVKGFGVNSIDPAIVGAFGTTGQGVMALIDAEVNRQAAMIAYLDDFKLMLVMTIVALPLVLLLRRQARPVAGAKDDTPHVAFD